MAHTSDIAGDSRPRELRTVPSKWLGLDMAAGMRRDFLSHCVALGQRYGDAVSYRVGPLRVVMLTHPEDNHDVLVANHRSFGKPAQLKKVLGQWNGNGLVVNEGSDWQRQRRLVQPAFKPQRLAAHVPVITRRVGTLLDGWEGHREVDAADDISRLTFGIVAEALFGADVEDQMDLFLDAIDVLNAAGVREMTSPIVLPVNAPTPAKRRMRRAIEAIDHVVLGVIAERERSPEDRGDLLSSLLLAVDEGHGHEAGDGNGQAAGGTGMSKRQVRDESVNLMLAGNETTAVGIIWTLYLLAQNPQVQEQVAADIDAAFGSSAPTEADVAKLKPALWAFQEGLRLYPPAYIVPREAVEDVMIGGMPIRKGTTVQIVPFITQRDPRWFDKADEFVPGRFEHDSDLPRGAYLPFGMGPRACVGRGMASIEAPVVIAMILQRFRVRLAASQGPVEIEAQVSIHPKGGLRLALEPR